MCGDVASDAGRWISNDADGDWNAEERTEMNSKEINAAISDARLFQKHPKHIWEDRDERRYFECQRCEEYIGWGDFSKEKGVFNDPCRGDSANYVEDLNAIHEAIRALDDQKLHTFTLELGKIGWREFPDQISDEAYKSRLRIFCVGTAHEHSEAYLRAIGKWVE